MDPIILANLLNKVDKIAEDSTYLRGKWDSTIPSLEALVQKHEKEIDDQGRLIANTQGKATVAGVVGGTFMSVFVGWIYSKIHF